MAVLSRHQEAAQLACPENILNHIADRLNCFAILLKQTPSVQLDNVGDEVSNLEKDIKFQSKKMSYSFVPEAYP